MNKTTKFIFTTALILATVAVTSTLINSLDAKSSLGFQRMEN